jgi:hypothetical protein
VAFVGTDASDESIASIIRVKGNSELGRKVSNCPLLQILFPTLNLATLMVDDIYSSETSVLARTTWRHIREDAILHSHCRESLKSYIALTGWTL